jgi:hypothetical protein
MTNYFYSLFLNIFSEVEFLISIGIEFHTTAPLYSRLFFKKIGVWFRDNKVVVMTSCTMTVN